MSEANTPPSKPNRAEAVEKAARHYAESQFYYCTDEDKGIAFQAFCEGVEWNKANPPRTEAVGDDEKAAMDHATDERLVIPFTRIMYDSFLAGAEHGRKTERERWKERISRATGVLFVGCQPDKGDLFAAVDDILNPRSGE